MKNALKILFLGAVGFLSLYLLFFRSPAKNSFFENGKAELSSYGLAFYGSPGNMIITISPLSDYYYDFSHREHIFNKLTKSDNGSFIDQLLISLRGLFINKKELVWNSEGENSRGETSVRYEVRHKGKEVELVRKVKFNKSKFTNMGEAIKICAGCFVADDKKRVYFNGALLTEDKIQIASKFNYIPFALGDNQTFPSDILKIFIVQRDGGIIAEIPVSNEEIFMEEQWQLLEFKTAFKLSKNTAETTQLIYINP